MAAANGAASYPPTVAAAQPAPAAPAAVPAAAQAAAPVVAPVVAQVVAPAAAPAVVTPVVVIPAAARAPVVAPVAAPVVAPVVAPVFAGRTFEVETVAAPSNINPAAAASNDATAFAPPARAAAPAAQDAPAARPVYPTIKPAGRREESSVAALTCVCVDIGLNDAACHREIAAYCGNKDVMPNRAACESMNQFYHGYNVTAAKAVVGFLTQTCAVEVPKDASACACLEVRKTRAGGKRRSQLLSPRDECA